MAQEESKLTYTNIPEKEKKKKNLGHAEKKGISIIIKEINIHKKLRQVTKERTLGYCDKKTNKCV